MNRLLTMGCLLAGLAGSVQRLHAQEVVLERERTHPYVNYTELGGLFGRVAYPVNTWNGRGDEQVENKVNLTIQTFNGVRVRPRLAVGGVVGVDWYNSALLLPVGAGLRYDLARPNQKNVQVFAAADIGYGLTWLDKSSTGYGLTRGGLMLNPGIGLRFGKLNRGGFVLSLSYKRQQLEAAKPLLSTDITRSESRVYNRLAVRLGVSF